MINQKDLFPIGIGTWGIGGLAEKDPNIDENKQVNAIAYMLNSGMNLVEANMWYSQGYSVEIFTKALEKSDLKRDEIFICQAVYLKDSGLDSVESEINQCLKLFNTDFIDTLQLTQSTFLKYSFEEIVSTLEQILQKGKTRFVSITNENLDLLEQFHSHFQNKLFSHEVCLNFEIRENITNGTIPYADKHKFQTVIFQPLRRNRTALRNWPLLVDLAKKYQATQNQIIFSWITSHGWIPLTKSETITHINEHLNSLKLKLKPDDLKLMDEFTPPNYNPPKVDWQKTGDGVRVDQLSNVFDEEYENQTSK